MTEQVDLDALITEARNRGDALRTLFPNDGDIRDDARLFETLADALKSTLAELRQERERADELHRMFRECRRTRSDLSRAEETIDRVLSALDPSTGDGAALDEARAILTEYDQQT